MAFGTDSSTGSRRLASVNRGHLKGLFGTIRQPYIWGGGTLGRITSGPIARTDSAGCDVPRGAPTQQRPTPSSQEGSVGESAARTLRIAFRGLDVTYEYLLEFVLACLNSDGMELVSMETAFAFNNWPVVLSSSCVSNQP